MKVEICFFPHVLFLMEPVPRRGTGRVNGVVGYDQPKPGHIIREVANLQKNIFLYNLKLIVTFRCMLICNFFLIFNV